MSNVDIELGQNETPKSQNESEADRVEKKFNNSQNTLFSDDWDTWSWEVLCHE